jgi:hypothetical protein
MIFIRCILGLSDGAIPEPGYLWLAEYPNAYAIPTVTRHSFYGCWLAGETHHFQLPEGAIRPRKKEYGNVYGCGIVLDPEDKLWLFFTLNGTLMGELV